MPKSTQCKHTSEENKVHHNADVGEPSQTVAEETQQLLKYSPLPQEDPAV